MAQSAWYEESAGSQNEKKEKRWYTAFQVLGIVCFVFTGFGAILSFSVIPNIIGSTSGLQRVISILVWVLGVAFTAGFGVLFFRMRRRFNQSYDYIFVEDELRITRVFNGRRRKHLCTLKADSILKIGYCESDSFERTLAGISGKPYFYTPNTEPAEEKTFIYILYSDSIGKRMYVIECRQMMLEYLVRAAGRTKFERQ